MNTAGLPLLEHLDAILARDKALAQVSSNSGDWLGLAYQTSLTILPRLPAEFIPETLRNELRLHIPEPHSPNCYGSLMMRLIKRGHVERTGRIGRSTSRASHATTSFYYKATEANCPSAS